MHKSSAFLGMVPCLDQSQCQQKHLFKQINNIIIDSNIHRENKIKS